jgi:hypothetical protein
MQLSQLAARHTCDNFLQAQHQSHDLAIKAERQLSLHSTVRLRVVVCKRTSCFAGASAVDHPNSGCNTAQQQQQLLQLLLCPLSSNQPRMHACTAAH